MKDILPPGLSIKTVGGKKQISVFNKDNQDVSDGITIIGPEIVDGKNELKIELPKIGIDDKYRIEYTTIVDYSGVNGGDYKKYNKFTNDAILLNDTIRIGDEDVKATVTTERKHLLSKNGSIPKEYQDELSWTINVNQAYHTISNAVLYDIIPKGLELYEDSIKIRMKVKNQEWEDLKNFNKDNIKVTDGSGDNEGQKMLTITFDPSISDEYEIAYNTKITGEGFGEGKKFKNNAWLIGNNRGDGEGEGSGGIGANGGTEQNPVSKDLTPKDNSYTKIPGDINYDEKTISWKIEIDPIKEPITELKIVDTFPNKGMIFLPDSLNIIKVNVNGTTTKVENGFSLTANKETVGGEEVTGYQKGFTIDFEKVTGVNQILDSQKMIITYKTSYDPQHKVEVMVDGVLFRTDKLDPYEKTDPNESGRAYTNIASITGKTKSDKVITEDLLESALGDKETDSPSWNSGKKEGRRVYLENGEVKEGWISGKPRLIEWKIYTNYLKQDLGTGVTVSDTLQYEGEIVSDSVEIRKYDVGVLDGKITDRDLVDIIYTKDLTSDNKTLKIKFTDKVSQRYVIIYRTTVPDKSKGVYENQAIVKVGNDSYPYGASVSYGEHEAFIEKTSSSGTSGSKVYTDDEIDWKIVINESLSTNMGNVVIEDAIAKGMAFKKGSLKVYRVEGGNEVEVDGGEDKEYTLGLVGDQNQDSGTKITVTFNNPIDHKYIIKYQTIVTATTGPVSNSAKVNGTHITGKNTSEVNYTAEKFGFTGGNLANRGSIKIVKTDDKTPSENLPGAKFEVYYLLNDVKQIVTDASGGDTHITNSSGEIDLKRLVLGREYFIEEVEAPSGYVLNSESLKKVTLVNENDKKDVELKFTNTELADARGSIKFTKKGEGEDLLGGAKFTLYKESDNSVVEVVESNENGIVEFKSVPIGKYIIKETTAPTGYVLSTDELRVEIEMNLQEVTPKKDGQEIEEVKNTFVRGNIEVNKEDGENNPLAGANFKLYKQTEDGRLGQEFKVDGESLIATSDATGLVEFKDIPYGKYIIKEVLAPDGYKASTEEIKVEIDAEGKSTLREDYTIVNEKIIGNIEVKKLDEDEKTGLPGAVFVLEQGGKAKYTSEPTDGSGSSIFKNVEYGKYTLREITPPEGYNLTDQTEKVEVKEEDQEPIVKRFINKKIRGGIKLKKVGESGEGLEGAEFSTFKLEDTEFKTPIHTAISDANGDVIFENVEYGKYNIKETKEPKGYNLSDKVIENVEIIEQGVEVIPTDNEISNTKIRGSIEILKRNGNTHSPLKGATIGLYSVIDILMDEKITGDDGKVLFEDLEYGSYYFKEIKAPSGYILDNTKYDFDIEDDGVTLERNLDNKRRPTPPTDPERPTDPGSPGSPGGSGRPTDPESRPDPKPDPRPESKPDPKPEPEPIDPTEDPDGPIIQEVPDLDPDPEPEEPLVPIVLDPPAKGTVTFDEDGNWIYTPNPGETGKDSFTLIHPDGTEELIEIDLDDVALGTASPDGPGGMLPKTGEGSNLGFYFTGLLLIVLGLFLRKRIA